MISTDPAGFDNESTGTHPVPLWNPVPVTEEVTDIPRALLDLRYAGLYFSAGIGPDGREFFARVDDPESPVWAPDADRDNRHRHLLRALLRHALDMLDGEDRS